MQTFTVRAAPLPLNFSGTPQQLFDLMLDRIEVVSDITNFVISDVDPGVNSGPWLKGGTKWYVWDNVINPAGAYIPLDLSDSLNDAVIVAREDPEFANTPEGISNYANQSPPKLPPRIWVQVDSASTTFMALWYNFGGTLGWVKGPQKSEASISLDSLRPSSSTAADYLVVVSSDGLRISTRRAPIALLPDLSAVDADKMVVVNPDGDGYAHGSVPVSPAVASPQMTLSGYDGHVQWAHLLPSVPVNVRAVLVCVSAENGFTAGMEMDLHSLSQGAGSMFGAVVTVGADATYCYAAWRVERSNSSDNPAGQMVTLDASARPQITLGNWRVKFYATVR